MAETESQDTNSLDRKCDDTSEDKKTENIEVHSANAWEAADLGDTDRKNKFLRLMGAGKKEHHGKFVIGDHDPDPTRKKDESGQLQNQLEDQYAHSMQHRLAGGRRGHIGLGYHDSDKTPNTEDAEDPDKTEDKDDHEARDEEKGDEDRDEKKDTGDEKVDEKVNRKRESTDGGEGADDEPDEKRAKSSA